MITCLIVHGPRCFVKHWTQLTTCAPKQPSSLVLDTIVIFRAWHLPFSWNEIVASGLESQSDCLFVCSL